MNISKCYIQKKKNLIVLLYLGYAAKFAEKQCLSVASSRGSTALLPFTIVHVLS